MIELCKALKLINNTETKESLRKFQPKWCTIVINREGLIIAILKHKREPSLSLNKEHMQKYPYSFQITAWQGRFNTEEELREAVKKATQLGKAN